MPAFEQITPHIYKLDLPFVNGYIPVGVWLVQEATGWTVVDAGAPEHEELVLEQILKQTGGVHPRYLLITHGHIDHAGAAALLRERWEVMIAAGRAEMPYLLGQERYNRVPADNWVYPLLQLSPPLLYGRNVQLPLDEGMVIGSLEAYHAPGHAPGMMAYLHREDRALICGDVFMNLKDRLSDPYALFTYDMALNRQSQAKLLELEFDHLLVSHGPPLMKMGRAKARTFVTERGKRR